jgi:hypothetical protein
MVLGIEWETPILHLGILRRGTFEVPRVSHSLPTLFYHSITYSTYPAPHIIRTILPTKPGQKTFGGRSGLAGWARQKIANRDIMQCVVQGLG